MKKAIFTLLIIFSYSCTSTKITSYESGKYYSVIKSSEPIHVPKPNKIPIPYSKSSYPYIHINGFRNITIKRSKYVTDSNKKRVNEICFNNTYSSFYTRKVMYDIFNNWDKNLFIKTKRVPYLIWENVKLLPNRNQGLYVVASGYEDTQSPEGIIYSSISVLDTKGNDCLTDKTPLLKKEIISFFTEKIKTLNNDNEFYSKFWGLILKKNNKKTN